MMPNWNPISISGYHIRAGATASRPRSLCEHDPIRDARHRGRTRGGFFAPRRPSLRRTVICSRRSPSFARQASRADHGPLSRRGRKRAALHTQTGGVTPPPSSRCRMRVAVQTLAATLGGHSPSTLTVMTRRSRCRRPRQRSSRCARNRCTSLALPARGSAAGSYYVENLTTHWKSVLELF
jgi:hypothetical protein